MLDSEPGATMLFSLWSASKYWVSRENQPKQANQTKAADRHSARNSRLVLGRADLSADQRNHRTSSRHSFRIDGADAPRRRSPHHEQDRLRRRSAFHQLAPAALEESPAPTDDHFQAALRAGFNRSRQARHRLTRRSNGSSRRRRMDQRQEAQRELHDRPH